MQHHNVVIPRNRLIFVLMGMTASGKTTLAKGLSANPDLCLKKPITTTTRAPRPGETNGLDYHFCSRDVFMRLVASGDHFIEYSPKDIMQQDPAQLPQQPCYGLSNHALLRVMHMGFDPIIVLDYNGAIALKEKYPEITHVFYLRFDPPHALDYARENIRLDENIGINCAERTNRLENEFFTKEIALFDDASKKTTAIIVDSVPGELPRMMREVSEIIQTKQRALPPPKDMLEIERF